MKYNLLLSGFLTLSSLAQASAAEPVKTDTVTSSAKLPSATVYFGYGAELTHESKLKVDPSTRIIIIDQLSNQIDLNSLQISMPEHVALLSYKYKVHYPAKPATVKTKEVENLEDSIAVLQKEIGRYEHSIVVEQEILSKTGLLIETTISNSGNKTITSAELLKLVEYYQARIEKSKSGIYNLNQQVKAHQKRIDDLKRKITAISVASPVAGKPYGQVIMQVICSKEGEIPVAMSYYTSYAGWTAVYDIRVNSKTNKVKLVYKASLTQTTGIDWKSTKLTLSTGTPNFGVSAPVLSPWYLQLYVPGIYTDLQKRAALGNAARNMIQSYNDDAALKEELVAADGDYKTRKSRDNVDPSTLQQYTTLNEGQLNTNFEIDLPYDIESDGQLHSVTVKDQEINCTLKNYAVPRVDRDAYLLAEIGDWQNLDLLPGDANIIMDDTYIGKSVIDPNSTSDTLNLSLGRDKRIAVKRSLIKEMSSLKTSGGYSRQVFMYEITVKNNKQTNVNLLLKDQFPLSTIREVEVKLEDSSDATINYETGVLTWKIDLKPGESRKVAFSYSVRYPKDKKIVNLK